MSKLIPTDFQKIVEQIAQNEKINNAAITNPTDNFPAGFSKKSKKTPAERFVKHIMKLNKNYEEAKESVNKLKDHKPEKKILLELIDKIDNHPENLGMDISDAKRKIIDDLKSIEENRKIEESKWIKLDKICKPLKKEGFKELKEALNKVSPEKKHEYKNIVKDLRNAALDLEGKKNLRGTDPCGALEDHRKKILGPEL